MTEAKEVEILLVEDNRDDLDMALHALRTINLANHVHVARDGVEALDFIFCRGPHAGRSNQSGPKVIMLDLKLPKVDGLEVLKQIKSNPQTQSIPVVVLTSSQEPDDVAKSYQLGGNSYIVKPVNFEAFETAIQQLGPYWMLLNQPPKL